jgi:hypothetical protein
MKYNKKKYHAPRRWRLANVLGIINNIKHTILATRKHTPEWYRLQYKRELNQIKKHIIFMEQLLDQSK